MLTLGISPCPNDTFAFHHLIHHVGGFEVTLDDVEALNRGVVEVTKISVAGFGHIRDRYAMLRAGGAAGFGVGPLLVAARDRPPGGRVAIPGARTTAALLLRLLGDFRTVEMRFDLIEDAVLRGEVDCGVLIHEGRFTYADKGLVKLADLGEVWEREMQAPIPLGAIAIQRSLGPEVARRIDAQIRASVEHAMAHPEESAAFVREHAQEMDPAVMQSHIDLYVNDYTLDLDEGAVVKLLDFGVAQGLFPPSDLPIFAY
ncbi:MAG: 1,4-dihydroxy-6-naphthoate synthase [Thermoanaerobaculia bacterium]|nr:1,4-dihydroxy-6-naphthoate synthase [Thermoanaerobaculia bacterium]